MQSRNTNQSLPRLFQRIPFFYGWIILPVASLGLFVSGPGQTYSFSVFINPMIEETGWSRSMVSGLYTFGSLTAALGMVIIGRLLDKFGPRSMLVFVGILFGLAALWMSQVSSPIQLYLGFFCMRLLGQGSLSLIPETLVAMWFVRLRGRVMALNSLGGVLSQAAFPILIFFLISHLGWRNTWVVIAIIIWCVLLAPAYLFVRRSPEEVGLLPDGLTDSINSDPLSSATSRPEITFSLSEALKTRSFYLLLLAGTSNSAISTAMVFHQASIIATKNLEPGLSASIFAVISPMILVGSFVSGYLIDKFPNRFILVIAQCILVSSMVVNLTSSTTAQTIAYGALLGLAGGFFITSNGAIWPNYYGRRHLGSIRGVVTTAMVASAAMGPWPFGLLFDLTGGYSLAILIFLALPISCIVAAFFATPPVRAPNNVGIP